MTNIVLPHTTGDSLVAQQTRLLTIVFTALLVGIVVTAPAFLLIFGMEGGGSLVGVQIVAAIFLASSLVQLRRGSLRAAVTLATIGLLFGLTFVFIGFGLRVSIPFFVVAFFPLAWAALFGGTRLTWIVIGVNVLAASIAALEQWNVPWIGVLKLEGDPAIAALITFIVVIVALGYFLLQTGVTLQNALVQSQARERELEGLREQLETIVIERTQALEQALQDVQAREMIVTQTLADLQSSQETIRELSAPVIPVLPGVVIAPLIGVLDSRRAVVITQQVLQAVEQHRARAIILDVTGVPIVDTQVAQILLQTASSAHLLGARVIVVGIRPEVAQTMVALHVDLHGITTFADLQSAIATLI